MTKQPPGGVHVPYILFYVSEMSEKMEESCQSDLSESTFQGISSDSESGVKVEQGSDIDGQDGEEIMEEDEPNNDEIKTGRLIYCFCIIFTYLQLKYL